MVVATTAKKTCRAPRSAATRGGSPWSRRRWMFSTTTMASSTTRPMASTRASSVSRFSEKPSGARTMKVDSKQMGATIDGMSAARRLPRKMKLTRATRAMAMPMVIHTSSMAWEVKTELSDPTSRVVPGGRLWRTSSIRARAPLEICRSLDWAWRVMARPIWSMPLPRNRRRASAGASSMRAMSPRRVT
ncbi:hypothetical protein D3C73_824340 [compost metagenome]